MDHKSILSLHSTLSLVQSFSRMTIPVYAVSADTFIKEQCSFFLISQATSNALGSGLPELAPFSKLGVRNMTPILVRDPGERARPFNHFISFF